MLIYIVIGIFFIVGIRRLNIVIISGIDNFIGF